MAGQIYIPIRYFGLDAERHELDLVSLGQSLQGAGRIIDIAASLVIPSKPPHGFRILASQPHGGCYEIAAILETLQPLLPILVSGSQKAIEGLVNYGVSKLTKKDEVASRAMDVAERAIVEMGATSRAAIEATASMRDIPKSAARQFLSPVGKSCDRALIGREETGAIAFDLSDRDAIEAQPIDIGPQAEYKILISEIDIINKTCKFALQGESDSRRYVGTITDPSVGLPNNTYASALAEGKWLTVSAKAELSDGRVTRLYISDSPA